MGHPLVNDPLYGQGRRRASICPVKRCTHGVSRSRIRARASRCSSKRRRPPATPRPRVASVGRLSAVAERFSLRTTSGAARRGSLALAHGTVETPCFMPVGTAATVKGLTPAELRDAQTQIVLANTYHLWLRPGRDVLEARRRTPSLHGVGRPDSDRLGRLSSLQPGRAAHARRRRRDVSLAPRRQRTSLYARKRRRISTKRSASTSRWCSTSA